MVIPVELYLKGMSVANRPERFSVDFEKYHGLSLRGETI